jgi:hypothetical protein
MVQLLWDVRSALEQDEAKMLNSIIAKYAHKESYYILKVSNWTNHDCNVLKSSYQLRSTKPPKMLGTVLWLVDNKKGSFEKIWELPLDVHCAREFLDPHNPQQIVAESAADISGAIRVI